MCCEHMTAITMRTFMCYRDGDESSIRISEATKNIYDVESSRAPFTLFALNTV